MAVSVIAILDHTVNQTLRDAVGPSLFDEDGLLVYLNEGYQQFARRTHCFVDSDTTITTVDGESKYLLPSGTIHLRGVWLDGQPLHNFTRKSRPNRTLPGKPWAFTTDGKQSWLRLYPTPESGYVLELDRAVLPEPLTQGGSVDLDHEWAYLLCQWVAYRALMNNDPDGSATIAADRFFKDWGFGVQNAKAEFTRRAMGDSPTAQPRRWT